MSEQKGFVDFNTGLGDTGQDNVSSIQPFNTGEGATQDVLRRPVENIRERTELLRQQTAELLYYRDKGHLLLEYSGGTVTWNGPGVATPLGKIAVTGGSFRLSPMLATKNAKKGFLNVGTATVNRVTYTVASTAFETQGMNAITVEHRDGGASATLSATVSPGPVKRIVVIFDSANTSHDGITAIGIIASAIAADVGTGGLAGKVLMTTSSVTGQTIAALAETRISNTSDDEAHVITATDIQTLTTATPLNTGMGVAIWYKYLIEPVTGDVDDPKAGLRGGRAESSVSRGTSAIPAAALFVTDSNPEKIPGAIPICRVANNGQLIWYDGTRLESGESTSFLSPAKVASDALAALVATLATDAGAATIGYAGSNVWKDGVTDIPASNVEFALDTVVNHLRTAVAPSGARKLGITATGFKGDLTAIGGGGAATSSDSIQEAIDDLDRQVSARRAFTAVLTRQAGGTSAADGDYIGANAIDKAFDATFNGGTFLLRRTGGSAQFDISNTVTNSGLQYRDLIGESYFFNGPKVNLASGRSANLQFSGGLKQNIFFTSSDTTYRYETNGSRIVDCAFQSDCATNTTGSVYAEGMVLNGANPLNKSRGYTVRGTGSYRNSTFLKLGGSPTAAGETVYIDSASIDNDTHVLLFENCSFYGGQQNGFPIKALYVANFLGASLVFRNCVFYTNDAGFTGYLVDIATTNGPNAGEITFENCYFHSSTGQAVRSVGVGCTFRRCHFEDGGISGVIAQPQLISGYGYSASNTLQFINCTASFGGALTANTTHPLIELGGTNNAQATNAFIGVDGFTVTYTSSMTRINPCTNIKIWSGSDTTSRYANVVKNLQIDFAGKTATAATAANAVAFTSADLGLLRIEGVTFAGIQNPTVGACLMTLMRADQCLMKDVFIKQTNVALNANSFEANMFQFIQSHCENFYWDGNGLRHGPGAAVYVDGSTGSNAQRASITGGNLEERPVNNTTFTPFIQLTKNATLKQFRAWGITPLGALVAIGAEYCTFEECKIYTTSGTAANSEVLRYDGTCEGGIVADNTIIVTATTTPTLVSGTPVGNIIAQNLFFNVNSTVPVIAPSNVSNTIANNRLSANVAAP